MRQVKIFFDILKFFRENLKYEDFETFKETISIFFKKKIKFLIFSKFLCDEKIVLLYRTRHVNDK